MLDAEKLTPCKLYRGVGSLSSLKSLVVDFNNVLLLTSKGMLSREIFEDISYCLSNTNVIVKTISSNPDLDKLDKLRQELSSQHIDLIVSFGGGSVMDAAKVLAVLLHPTNNAISLESILRKGAPFTSKRLSLINIPTTSGTGAEVTPFATVWDFANSKKKSLSSLALVPDLVILDPKTTYGSPQALTVNCALDTCSHAMESLWNKNSTSQSVVLASEALRILVDELPKLLQKDSLTSREKLQVSTLLAGLAISINRTAIAHSISYPVTLHFGVPHGLACAFTLPRIAEMVSQQNAWVEGTDQELIKKVLSLLDNLCLDKMLSQYCSREQILKLTSEMTTKGRADNFVLDDFSLEAIVS